MVAGTWLESAIPTGLMLVPGAPFARLPDDAAVHPHCSQAIKKMVSMPHCRVLVPQQIVFLRLGGSGDDQEPGADASDMSTRPAGTEVG